MMGYRVIILEDNKIDSQLMKEFLVRSHEPFSEFKLVYDKEEYMQVLQNFPADLIISDYRLKGFDGVDALHLRNMYKAEVPIVIVSATIGEEKAVELIKNGASDFLIKNNIESRLVQVCVRALAETREKQDRKLAEEKLKASLIEKEILLMEIHHRVKNNLAVISGLLQLESMNSHNDETVNVLSNSVMRIKSMAIIHEQLYSTHSFNKIPFHNCLEDLILAIQQKIDPVKIKRNLNEVYLNINFAVPAALLFNELIAKVNKYMHLSKKKEDIQVHLIIENNKICMKVECICSSELEQEESNSLNFMLINALSTQLEAELIIEKEKDISFTVKFENKDKKGSSGSHFPT